MIKKVNKKVLKKSIKKSKVKRNLYFTNRKLYYKRHKTRFKEIAHKKIVTRGKSLKKGMHTPSSNKKYYRYSLTFYNAKYSRNFRVEVYTDKELNETAIHRQLQNFMFISIDKMRFRTQNQKLGMLDIWQKSKDMGLESEEIGTNDIRGETLNRIRFYYEDLS